MQIRRERDAALVNRIANLPEVKPWLSRHGDDRPLDFSNIIHGVVFLSNGEDAVIAFEQATDREWECATMFAPSCRGRRALDTALEMKAWMLPHADMIFGSIPDNREFARARWFYSAMGGERVGAVTLADGRTAHAQPNEVLFACRDLH